MADRSAWLLDIHRQAERLLTYPSCEARMDALFAPGQRGKWGRDEISGYYWYLHALIAVIRPKKVVELGRRLGTSALFMLGALNEDATLITVDTQEPAPELAHCFGDPRLQVVLGNDLDLSIYENIDMTEIGFLFVDTNHTYEQAMKEWELYSPLLSNDAVVAFDDITMNDMPRAWDAMPGAKLETDTTYHHTGFGLVAP